MVMPVEERVKMKNRCGMCVTNNHEICRVVISNGVHGLLWCPCGCEQTDEYVETSFARAEKNLAFELRSKKMSGR